MKSREPASGTPSPVTLEERTGLTICGLFKRRDKEFAYRKNQAAQIGNNTLLTAVIAGLIFFGSAPYDYFNLQFSNAFWLLFLIRAGGLGFGLWLGYAAYRYRDPERSNLTALMTAFEAYIALGFLVIVLTHGGDVAFHTISAMAVVLAFYVFLPNFGRIQFLIPPVFTLLFLVLMHFPLQQSADEMLVPSIILVLVNALGWQFARMSNQSHRLAFQSLMMQQKLNDELRSEIAVRKRAEDSLQHLFDAAPVPMVLTRGRDGVVMRANQLALNLFEAQPEQIDSYRAQDFYVDPAQRSILFDRINAEGSVHGFEVKMVTARGHRFEGLLSAHQIAFDNDHDCVFVGVMDITEINRIKAELQKLANLDPLTGIRNRRAFFDACETELRRRTRDHHEMSMLLLDVDEFKRINDQYGHATGDIVLQTLAQRMQQHIREFDVLARIGGEEFAILLPGLDVAAATEVAERLGDLVKQPIPINDETPALQITISTGIAAVALDDHMVDTALNEADRAMYSAKRHGRDRVEIATDAPQT